LIEKVEVMTLENQKL
jgi:hypothetical protein